MWTLIGVFAASMFGALSLQSTLLVLVIKAEIRGLRTEMNAKFDVLDRDIQAIARHVFGDPGA